MSASLVGSEMCIRDRGLPTSLRHHRCSVQPRPPQKSACLECAGRGAGSCLLYTSDAADDM
eukprot:13840889-Alexandrium_andersonii.AAC.1